MGAPDLERESARSVLVFVGQLAGRCMGQLDRYKAQVEGALAAHGEGLTRLIFAALAVSEERRINDYILLLVETPPTWRGGKGRFPAETGCCRWELLYKTRGVFWGGQEFS